MFGAALRAAMTPLTQPDPGYIAAAVRFDGSDSYDILEGDAIAAGVVDSQVGIISCWYKRITTSSFQHIWSCKQQEFRVRFESQGNGGQLTVFSNIGTDMDLRTSGNQTVDGMWHHLLCSFDKSGSSRHLYLDNAEDLDEFAAGGTGSVPYESRQRVGARASDSAFPLNAELADLYVNYVTYQDFSLVANRLKFISGNNKPVFLGDTGQLPTGLQPAYFFSGDKDEFHVNKGYGGSLTGGTITDATSSPS